MNVTWTSVLAVGIAVVAVVIAAGSAAVFSLPGSHATFVHECETSLNSAADWAIAEATRQRKDVGFMARARIASAIPALCKCGRDGLGTSIADDKLALAGKLIGMHFQMTLAMHAADPSLRARATEAARRELKQLMSENKVTLAEVGALSRKVDGAFSTCMQHNR